MRRGPCAFRKSDVKRAVEAVIDAMHNKCGAVGATRIDPVTGEITVMIAKPGDRPCEQSTTERRETEWDGAEV